MAKLSIGRAWDEAKAMLAADRQRLVPVALTLLLLPAALMTMVSGAESNGDMRQLPPGGWAALLALLLVSVAGNLTLARLALAPSDSVGDALKRAAIRMWSLLGAFILMVVPFLLVLSVLSVATGIRPDAAAAAKPGAGLDLAVLALLIGFFYIAVRLSLCNVVAAAEEGGPVALLKRGFELSRGAFWRLFAFILLLVVAAGVISIAVGMLAGILVAFGDGSVEPLTLSALFLGLVQGAIQAGLAVIYILMLVSLYRQANAAA